jgi:hypothetical protein
MTSCSKSVQEIEYKFFHTHSDAKLDINFWIESVDVEGGSPPDKVTSKIMKEEFSLRPFPRLTGIDRFIEQIYLKQ